MPQETPRYLTRLEIDRIFGAAEHQQDYVIELHKSALQLFGVSWDDVKRLDGYVKIAKGGNKYIYHKAIDFDKEHHPRVIAGGSWMNSGFSSYDNDLDNAADVMFEVTILSITYQ